MTSNPVLGSDASSATSQVQTCVRRLILSREEEMGMGVVAALGCDYLHRSGAHR